MIKACGGVTWYIEEDGTVSFYLKGNKRLSMKQFKRWMKRKFSAP